MGQRLVVTINNDGREIAKIYYHWSAYSYSALQRVQRIVHCIYDHNDETEKELLLRLIRFCELSGGGIRGDEKEFEYIKAMYPGEKFKEDGYSRNDGLIALSESGMADLQNWSEGDVDICIDRDVIHNTVYCYYENIEEYNEERKEWDEDFEDLKLEDVPELSFDLGYISVADIDAAVEELYGYDDVVRCGNEIFELIE